jgi:hypothetical protein
MPCPDESTSSSQTTKRADRSLPFESRGMKPCYRRAHAAISAMPREYTRSPLGFQAVGAMVSDFIAAD